MFADAAKIQGRVLVTLMLREASTRYRGRQLGYLWALIEPLLHILGFAALLTFMGRVAPLGDSLLVFLATGMSSFFGFKNVLKRMRRGGIADDYLLRFPVIKMPDILIARGLLALATWIVVTIILLGGLIVLGYGALPNRLLPMLISILALFCMGFGAGVTIGILTQFVPSLGSFLRLPLRVLYFTSSGFFLPENMVPILRDIVVWNPVLHGVTLFRMGYYEHYESTVFDPEYMGLWALGSLFVGLLALRVFRKALLNRD